jgi:NADPH-dependent curcumin reductase CurA
MTEMKNRQWLLARRPEGALKDSDFTFVESDIPAPGEGEVLVRNLLLSCDPTQRAWIACDTYLPAVKIGEVVRSFGAGRIEASNHPGFKAGDIVLGLVGWQDYAATNPNGLTKLPPGAPIELAMGALGMIGITAYFGLLDIGRPKEGETVVVSGAAGATGSLVGQIAKIKGCRVIGVAGGAEKCRWLTHDLGFDAAIDYKADNVKARLKEFARRASTSSSTMSAVRSWTRRLRGWRCAAGSCSAAASRPTTPPNRRRGRGTTSTWSQSAGGWKAFSSPTTCRAPTRRSGPSRVGSRKAS